MIFFFGKAAKVLRNCGKIVQLVSGNQGRLRAQDSLTSATDC